MFGLIGIAVIFGMVFGGYLLAGGKMGIILKSLPFEMMMIGGAAAGAFLTALVFGFIFGLIFGLIFLFFFHTLFIRFVYELVFLFPGGNQLSVFFQLLFNFFSCKISH